MTGDAAKIEFGGALTLIHNNTEDQLTCSGKIQASDVLIEGTSTTVADLIGEVAALRQDMAAVKQFVGMMPPPPPLPPPPSAPPGPTTVALPDSSASRVKVSTHGSCAGWSNTWAHLNATYDPSTTSWTLVVPEPTSCSSACATNCGMTHPVWLSAWACASNYGTNGQFVLDLGSKCSFGSTMVLQIGPGWNSAGSFTCSGGSLASSCSDSGTCSASQTCTRSMACCSGATQMTVNGGGYCGAAQLVNQAFDIICDASLV